MKNIYEEVTNKILTAMENGVLPWRKPWLGDENQNLISRRPYRGVNAILTTIGGFTSPFWLTFSQANTLGGKIKSGSQGTMIIWWSWITPKNENIKEDESRRAPFAVLKYYYIFNLDQIDGLPSEKIPEIRNPHLKPVQAAEKIWNEYPKKPRITFGGNKAIYSYCNDTITLPPFENFNSEEGFYETLFHEAIHSTGHETRLNRELQTQDISRYSFEELVAELGAAFLCSRAGLVQADIANMASYVNGWASYLQNDKQAIIRAAAKAQKAAAYILNETEIKSQEVA